MTIDIVTIDDVDYIAYATATEANDRMKVDPVRGPSWNALDQREQDVLRVASAFRLDLLSYKGEQTGGATQVNQWPRKGVTYPDGTPVPDNDVPVEVGIASILMAGTIALTPEASGSGNRDDNTKRLKAGSAEIEFFRPTRGTGPVQDQTVLDLLRWFLASSSVASAAVPFASGTDQKSRFKSDPYGLTEGL